jgi:hypothetical protein
MTVLKWTIVAVGIAQMTHAESDINMDCTLACANLAKCEFGSSPEESKHETSLPFLAQTEDHKNDAGFIMHCVCPHGWTGIFCDVPFDTCYAPGDTDENETNVHHCYHGGQCIPGLTDHYGNDQLFCDCTDARDEQGRPYLGKYCELQASTHCTGDDPNGNPRYCMNRSICNPQYPKEG